MCASVPIGTVDSLAVIATHSSSRFLSTVGGELSELAAGNWRAGMEHAAMKVLRCNLILLVLGCTVLVSARDRGSCLGEFLYCEASSACAMFSEDCTLCGPGEYVCPDRESCAPTAVAYKDCYGIAVGFSFFPFFPQCVQVSATILTHSAGNAPRLAVTD